MGLSSPWSPRNYRTLPTPTHESQQYSSRGGSVYEDSNALHLILLESWPQLNLHARNNIKTQFFVRQEQASDQFSSLLATVATTSFIH